MEEQEKEKNEISVFSKISVDNEEMKEESKFKELKSLLTSHTELVIFILSVVIPAILGASYKLRRSSYYGYPVEFFDVNFTYMISRAIMIAYFTIIILGVRVFKNLKKYEECILVSNLVISFLIAIEILKNISFLLFYYDKEYIADYFSFSIWYIAAYLISFIAISRKKDFEIFKKIYEESKKKKDKVLIFEKIYVWFVEIVLCLTSFLEKIKKLKNYLKYSM